MIGKIKEIYIPNENNNGRIVSYLDSQKVGFKVIIDDNEMDIVVNQNNDNAVIHVGDLVNIKEINGDNGMKYFISKIEEDE